MSYTAIQGNPITVNIVAAANDTGWSVSGNIATHESCNAGRIRLLGFTPIIGTTYIVTYKVDSISGGYVKLTFGGVDGSNVTTTGFQTLTVTATGTSSYFFSNANCAIELVNIQIQPIPITNMQQNTIAYSQKDAKWVSFYTMVPDCGVGLNTNVYTASQGRIYAHETGTTQRNNLYGTQYQSIIQFVAAKNPSVPQMFQSISLQCNELMVTTPMGITTSLGQISELAQVDFVKDFLNDGVSEINLQSLEGIWAANFLRDMNSPDGLLDGDVLRGDYMLVTLISTNSMALQLFTINVVSRRSAIGSR